MGGRYCAGVIETEGLTKRYGQRDAVSNLTVSIPRGVIAGFVGPNGSGKTTTIRMLLGLVRPTSGTARVMGHPITHPRQYLHRIGALIEGPAFYPGLSARANLQVLATLGGFPHSRIPGLLEQVGLADRAGDRVGGYSLGMKQRLALRQRCSLSRSCSSSMSPPTAWILPGSTRCVR